MKKPAAFLDRDGVINIDTGYVYKIKDFKWIRDAKEAIKYIKNKGFLVIVITNQSGITRGYYSEKDVINLHKYINNQLANLNTQIDEFFYSPFHPDVKNEKYNHLSHLRKPNTGMIELATEKWSIDLDNSFLIGNSDTDIQCAENYGIVGYLYKEGSLLDFIKKIIP